MRRTLILAAIAASATILTGCASGPRGPSNAVIARALSGAPGAAQPSSIVSTEIAYARAAKEQGLSGASADFAAPGALMHGRNGPVPLTAIAGALGGRDEAPAWVTRVVVQSCDGSLALSQGRFQDAEGYVGNYVTVWTRQSDGSFRWTYDVAGRDNPQPPPPEDFEDGDIVVTALDSIQGLVATCPRGGDPVPPPPAIPVGEEGAADAQLSRDGTLRWRWEHRADGTKYVSADYFYAGQWVAAIEEELASPPEE